MKVLLFTHKIDIDGMGGAVLARLAFKNVDIKFLETFEVDDALQEIIENETVNNYSNVYITDICPSETYLTLIESDAGLKNKIKIFDHHKNNFSKAYDFADIQISNQKGLCCGTSLFYDYLRKQGFLKQTKALDDYVELTRQYDTWEWKDIYNNEIANNLNLLFVATDRDCYVKKMLEYLQNEQEFQLKSKEIAIIENYKREIAEGVENLIASIFEIKIDGMKVAVIASAENKFRNEVSGVLKIRGCDCDYLAMVIQDRDTISLRSIKDEIDVSMVASKLGGKGHKKASSVPKTKDNLKYFGVEK